MLQTIQTPSPVIISNYSLRPRSGASGEQEFICCFGYFYLSKNISGWCDGARVDEWFVERLTDVACKSYVVLWVWSPCVPVWCSVDYCVWHLTCPPTTCIISRRCSSGLPPVWCYLDIYLSTDWDTQDRSMSAQLSELFSCANFLLLLVFMLMKDQMLRRSILHKD